VIIGVLIAAIVVGGGYVVDRERRATESLLSGYFESQPSIASSRLGGRVVQILVREGDTVKKGQPLVRMEDASYRSSYEAQKQAEEQARQQYLETARGPRPEEIEQARQAAAEAQANFDKLRNGSRPEDIQSARDRLAQTEAIYQKMVAGSRPEEIAAAHATADLALAKLQQAQRGLTREERAELKARLDAARAAQDLANKQLTRTQALYQQGAAPKQEYDSALSAQQQAAAATRDAAQTYKRAMEGTPREELDQARDGYRQALAQLQLVKKGNRPEDIEAARQDMLMARENLILAVKGPRKEDIDAAKAHLDQMNAALAELLKGSRAEDIAKAKAAQQEVALQAKSTGENLQERTVYAPEDTIVDRVLVADGDLMTPNAPVVQLSDPTDIWLRVYVPEAQLKKIRVGDDAELAIDGVSGIVKAKVESIATQGEFTPANLQTPEERGKQVFGVRLRLAATDLRVKAGMYATVRKVGGWP